MISHAEALAVTPKLYRRHVTKDRLESDRSIVFKRSLQSAIPWWEPYQCSRDAAEVILRPEWGWEYFGTFTFKSHVHPEAAVKAYNRMIHWVNREVFGKRYWNNKDKGILHVFSMEMQKRDVLHFHNLMSRIDGSLRRLEIMDQWCDVMKCGIARVRQFEPGQGAEQYLAKYLSKGGELYFDGPVHLVASRMGFSWDSTR